MKKTLNVNIGSMSFIIDEDAYVALSKYFDDIRSRLDDTDTKEVMEDVESRMADIFTENLRGSSQVVSIELVKRGIAIIGSAQNFGDPRSGANPDTSAQTNAAPDNRLYRSRTECVIAGLCGGLAQYFGIDVTLIRVVTFLLIFFGGLSLWVYIILWLVIPKQPLISDFFNYDNKTN